MEAKKTEYVGFRATEETLAHIKELQSKEDSVSSVIRNAINFYYDYVEGILDLLQED